MKGNYSIPNNARTSRMVKNPHFMMNVVFNAHTKICAMTSYAVSLILELALRKYYFTSYIVNSV